MTVNVTASEPCSSIRVAVEPSGPGETDLVSWQVQGATAQMAINPMVGSTYTYQFTLNVTPKAGPVRFLPAVIVIRAVDKSGAQYSNTANVSAQASNTIGRVFTGTATTLQVVQTFSAQGRDVRVISYNRVSTLYVVTGNDITVQDPSTDTSIHFQEVTEAGDIRVDVTSEEPAPVSVFAFLGKYYDVSTQASYSGNVTITIAYDEAGMTPTEEALRLYHWNGQDWEDVTVLPVDTGNNRITGVVASLSWFSLGVSPEVTWLPPLSTQEIYIAQDGSTVPIKFRLTGVEGSLISEAHVIVTITRDSDGVTVLTGPAVYQPDIPGYKINAQTKEWKVGLYTIRLSIKQDATYGLSFVEKGQAKGKGK